jgi:uncharacterized glyoxalase superfamily protein PhnB
MSITQTQIPSSCFFPVLRYRNAANTLSWLGDAFGLQTRFQVSGAGDSILHSELVLGQGMVMVSAGGEPDPAYPCSQTDHGIYVYVADIDAHYRRAVAAGAEIVIPLRATDYGSREFSARDLEGHLWSFGTYQPWNNGS